MPHSPDTPSAHVGDRLRELRRRRGLTQEQLAARSSRSLALIKKLEQGGTARLDSYHALARALGVRTSALLDPAGPHETRRTPGDDVDLMPLRQAIAPPITITGRLTPADTADGEPDIDQLRATAHTLAVAYHADGYDTVADLLPALIGAAHATVDHHAHGPRESEALAVRADILQMAGRYLTQVRAYDLAHVALRDAIGDAVKVGDLDVVAGAVYQQGWLLMRQGRLDEAEAVSVATAEAVEPRISRASSRSLGGWGKLLVHGSAAAARNNRPTEAREMLRLGRTAGAALTGGTVVAESSWGRFDWRTVALQGIENQLVAEQPGRVLRLSERVADAGSTTFLRRHLLDVAAAHVLLRQRREAMTVLDRLYTETPAWLRHQRMATQVFHDAQQLGGRATGQERRLAVFFDAP